MLAPNLAMCQLAAWAENAVKLELELSKKQKQSNYFGFWRHIKLKLLLYIAAIFFMSIARTIMSKDISHKVCLQMIREHQQKLLPCLVDFGLSGSVK